MSIKHLNILFLKIRYKKERLRQKYKINEGEMLTQIKSIHFLWGGHKAGLKISRRENKGKLA